MITKTPLPKFDMRLGRIIEHDSRSLEFSFNTTGLSVVDVTHTRYVPIFNQGQVGSCTGNAGIGAISTAPFLNQDNTTYSRDEAGALKLYSNAEQIDGHGGYPPTDDGSSGLSIAKALTNAGLISGYQHVFTLNDALKAGSLYAFITGITWYSDMFTPDADGRVHPTGSVAGGHEIELSQIDVENGRVWFNNSWGTSWGIKGRFYLTWADFEKLLAEQGDVIVLIPPHITPPPPVSTTWKYFVPTEPTGGGHTVAELNVNLVDMLDIARGIAGVPFNITSGFRTVAENAAAGGVPNSAHLVGMAADIAVTTHTRESVMKGLLTCGVPLFIEDAVYHIHADIDSAIHPLGDEIISQNG